MACRLCIKTAPEVAQECQLRGPAYRQAIPPTVPAPVWLRFRKSSRKKPRRSGAKVARLVSGLAGLTRGSAIVRGRPDIETNFAGRWLSSAGLPPMSGARSWVLCRARVLRVGKPRYGTKTFSLAVLRRGFFCETTFGDRSLSRRACC